MSNKNLVKITKKLLSFKNKDYRRKYHMLSSLYETNIKDNNDLMSEFKCLVRSLNSSDGLYPKENYIVEFYKDALNASGLNENLIQYKLRNLQKEVNLYHSKNIDSTYNIMFEALDDVIYSNKKLDKKLEETLIESINRNISILKEAKYEDSNIVDLTDIDTLDLMSPVDTELSSIESEEKVSTIPSKKEEREVLEKYKDLFTKENIPYIRKTLNFYIPLESDPAELPVIDKLTIAARYVLIEEQKATPEALMKIELIEKIRNYLNVRRDFMDDDIKAIASTGAVIGRPEEISSMSSGLSDERRQQLTQRLYKLIQRIGGKLSGQTLNSDVIKKEELVELLFNAAGKLQKDAKTYISYLENKYGEDLPEEIQSDEEKEQTQREVDQYFEELTAEDEFDAYAVEEDQKYIDVDKATSSIRALPVIKMTVIDWSDLQKELASYRERLRELDDKILSANPRAFDDISVDSEGNLNYDQIEVILAEGLTDQEIKEYISLLKKVTAEKKIEIINLKDKSAIYDTLYQRGATPEEYMSFMKSFGLLDPQKASSYRQVAQSSRGQFRDSAGARQFALKAWFKGNYFSLNPAEKAKMYAELGEKWFERITVLDLISDEAFARPGDRPTPKLNRYFEKIPNFLTQKGIERYFDSATDESLETQVDEKIQSALSMASTEEDFTSIIQRLEKEDPTVEKYAILNTLFSDTSAFRIFSSTMFKEFYNSYVWGQIESDLAFAIKEYFDRYYKGSNIGASLQKGEKSKDVPKNEGKDLFNPIIYLAMSRVGLPGAEAFSTAGGSEQAQRDYFLGKVNKKGDFGEKVRAYTSTQKTGGLYGREDGRYNPAARKPFGQKDVEMLLDDIFSDSGIIGKVRARIRKITSDSSNEFITFLYSYDEGKLDQIIVNSFAMSHVLRTGADPLSEDIFADVGKESVAALSKYKDEFAKQLTATSFAEYLSDEYGYEIMNKKKKGASGNLTKQML